LEGAANCTFGTSFCMAQTLFFGNSSFLPFPVPALFESGLLPKLHLPGFFSGGRTTALSLLTGRMAVLVQVFLPSLFPLTHNCPPNFLGTTWPALLSRQRFNAVGRERDCGSPSGRFEAFFVYLLFNL